VSVASLAISGCGAVVLGASVVAARGPVIPAWEVRAFRTINRLPGWLLYPLWPVMQLGNLAVGTAAGLLVAWWAGELPVAIAVLVATGLKLVAERLIRRELTGRLPARNRPGSSQPDPILRGGDVPSSGPSFPSGHALLIAALACVVAPVLPGGWELVPAVLMLLVMVGRVFVGAHNPLDVISGAGAGLMVGGLVASLLPPT
jgi:membrane-associated phospholipid phosphatase